MDRLERATYWRGHVEAWRQSDMTQIAYCALHGLNPKAFYRWQRKFEAEHTAAGERLPLLPVRMETAQTAQTVGAIGEPLDAGGLRLRSPGGWVVKLSAPNPAGLAELLRCLP